jgi:glycerophosphoryl diester phosphodiesterase
MSHHLPSENFLIIAHRGFSGAFPENTLLAFDEAVKVGAPAMEFDVQLDADDEAVVFHDFVLGRTTPEEDEGTRVRDLTTEEFLELDVGAYKDFEFYDTPPALLGEVLDRYAEKAFLNIELKVFDENDAEEINTLARRTLELIREHRWNNGLISSFCPAVLRAIKALDHSLPIALLGPKIHERNLLEDAIALGAKAYNFDGRGGVTPDDIAAIHRADLKAYAYTINDESRARELREMGVDGIFTDHPDLMLKL